MNYEHLHVFEIASNLRRKTLVRVTGLKQLKTDNQRLQACETVYSRAIYFEPPARLKRKKVNLYLNLHFCDMNLLRGDLSFARVTAKIGTN